MRSHKELIVWQKSYKLTKDIYLVTKKFPKEEMYGMTSQMRRAAYSIPTNIAEGYRRSTKEYAYFLSVALGSASELETFLLLSKDLEYISETEMNILYNLNEEIIRMLHKIISGLRP